MSKRGTPPACRTLRSLSSCLGMEFVGPPNEGASLPLSTPATPPCVPCTSDGVSTRHVPPASRTDLSALWGASLSLFSYRCWTPALSPAPKEARIPRELHGQEDCGIRGHGPQHGPACSSPSKGAATMTCAEGQACVCEPHAVPTRGARSRIRESARRDREHSVSSVHSVLSPALKTFLRPSSPPGGRG